jgi:hypothetical protein
MGMAVMLGTIAFGEVSVTGRGSATGDESSKTVVLEDLGDEYKARALYRLAIEMFDEERPFIVAALATCVTTSRYDRFQHEEAVADGQGWSVMSFIAPDAY